MLIQSSIPSSFEAALSFVSDDRKHDFLCGWIPRGENCPSHLSCDELPRDGCQESSSTWELKDNTADSSSLVHSPVCCKLSSISNMCASSSPNLVYKRRKLQTNSAALLSAQQEYSSKGADALSNSTLKEDSLGQRKNSNDSSGASVHSTTICNNDLMCNGNASTSGQVDCPNLSVVPCENNEKMKGVEVVPKSVSLDGYKGAEEQQSDEAQDNKSALGCYNDNDKFSSSKSNLEIGSASLKTDMDDTGECSSSGLLTAENISEKELCISILKSYGLLERALPVGTLDSVDGLGINRDNKCSRLCKICGHTENSLSMLICDNCEDAFHVSCCNPKIKKMPVDEWYCHSCLRKKNKFSVESGIKNSSKIKSEGSERRNRASKRGSNLVENMLNDSEPYKSNVRVGKGFQADIPEWSGPISEEDDSFGEPLEIDPSECGNSNEWSGRNTNRLSKPTVGNWLQCREVLDDAGTICGKWRRAPLFEVQTDDWDCSCSVLWDPIHSDCAVPQELDTEQVLVHLKYIQLLRPRLASKQQKVIPPQSDTEEARIATSEPGGDT